MRYAEALGVHGIVLPSKNPDADAREWARALGWPVLSRTAREVVLGYGPELFIAFARDPGAQADTERSVEIHLAVHELREARRRPDALGGDSVIRVFGAGRLVLREFRRPPSGRWKRPRTPGPASRSRRSGKKQVRSGAG